MLPKELKQSVYNRANGLCEYCKSPEKYSTDSFCMEHIFPQCRGGETTAENLALSCMGCNNHKYVKTEGKDPFTGETVKLYHPRKHNWTEHFVWADNATIIFGVSATGRATVAELQLNRQRLINLRKLLFDSGEHPPIEE